MSIAVPKLISEMPAVAALVPLGDVTHTAVATGDWSNPTTWADGIVPGAGAKVLIDGALEVTFDVVSSPRLASVRVDGLSKLNFATDQNTKMLVETVVIGRDAQINIGTEATPLSDSFTAELIFADNGDLDPATDVQLLGRGLIVFGAANMWGAEKTSFAMVNAHPMATDTTLTFDTPPIGWKAGDRIHICGTHYEGRDKHGVNVPLTGENRAITGTPTATVTMDSALTLDHDVNEFAIAPAHGQKTRVMNMSRNIVIGTENGATALDHRRGHVMFMHNPAQRINNVEFFELGRTVKKYKATDPLYLPAQLPFEFDPLIPDSNVKGRYACHFHHTGVASLEFADQAFLFGCAVTGSPGWGFAQHDSNVMMYQNVAIDCDGAALSAEAGQERGLWKENWAANCQATRVITPKLMGGSGVYDLGRGGDAYNFQSRQIRMIDNGAQCCATGSAHFTRGRHDGSAHPNGILDGKVQFNAAETDLPDLFGYTGSFNNDVHPILHHSGHVSISNGIGIYVEKAGGKQFHALRTVFQDFACLGNHNYGVDFAYTSQYTATNGQILGLWDVGEYAHVGFRSGPDAFDLSLTNSVVEANNYTYSLDNKFTPDATLHNVGMTNRAHMVGDNDTYDFQISESETKVAYGQQWTPAYTDVSLDLATPFSITLAGPNAHADGFNFYDYSGADLVYDFSRTDTMGTVATQSDAERYVFKRNQVIGLLQNLGYWTEANGDKWLLAPLYFGDRGTGDPHKQFEPIRLQVNTSSGLYAATNNGPIDFSTPPDLDNLTVSSVFPPLNGRISDKGNDEYWYYPDPGFDGVEDVVYWLTDQKGYIERHVITFDASGTKFGDYIVLDLAGGRSSPVFGSAMWIGFALQ